MIEQTAEKRLHHERGRDHLRKAIDAVPVGDLLPHPFRTVPLIAEQRFEPVAVRDPYAVEIARRKPFGAEELFGAASHHGKSDAERIVPRQPPVGPSADVVDLFPEAAEFARAVPFEKAADQIARIPRAHPFERGIEAGMEHESVAHVALQHFRMQHGRLPQNDPAFQAGFEDIPLGAQLVQGIQIKRTDDERIPHPAEGVLFVAAAVEGDA